MPGRAVLAGSLLNSQYSDFEEDSAISLKIINFRSNNLLIIQTKAIRKMADYFQYYPETEDIDQFHFIEQSQNIENNDIESIIEVSEWLNLPTPLDIPDNAMSSEITTEKPYSDAKLEEKGWTNIDNFISDSTFETYPSSHLSQEGFPDVVNQDYPLISSYLQLETMSNQVVHRHEIEGAYLDVSSEELKSECRKKRKGTIKVSPLNYEEVIEYTIESYTPLSPEKSSKPKKSNPGSKNYKGTLTRALPRLCATNPKYIQEMNKEIARWSSSFPGDLYAAMNKYLTENVQGKTKYMTSKGKMADNSKVSTSKEIYNVFYSTEADDHQTRILKSIARHMLFFMLTHENNYEAFIKSNECNSTAEAKEFMLRNKTQIINVFKDPLQYKAKFV